MNLCEQKCPNCSGNLIVVKSDFYFRPKYRRSGNDLSKSPIYYECPDCNAIYVPVTLMRVRDRK
jgi:hypothetical protein